MEKRIIIVRDREETIKDFKKRTEILSLTLDNQHHYENETDNSVEFVIY